MACGGEDVGGVHALEVGGGGAGAVADEAEADLGGVAQLLLVGEVAEVVEWEEEVDGAGKEGGGDVGRGIAPETAKLMKFSGTTRSCVHAKGNSWVKVPIAKHHDVRQLMMSRYRQLPVYAPMDCGSGECTRVTRFRLWGPLGNF